MNLRDYEHAKFELAELLRTVAAWNRSPSDAERARVQDLFARIAEDRFNLVVVGRFSRGKTTLMNALLGTDRLPMGVIPLTSVITTVAYGSEEAVVIRYHGHRLDETITLDALSEYVTQRHNPGNARRVLMAEVRLPIEILRRGFYFIDTPGLGSSIVQNTRTTEAFLPEADAFILVTSYESPLSMEDLEILRTAASSGRQVFVVINKQDLVSETELQEALHYVRRELGDRASPPRLQVFSVSARDGLAAKQSGSGQLLTASGIPVLEKALVRFLIERKQREFLVQLCARVGALAAQTPAHDESCRLATRLAVLAERIGSHAEVESPVDGTPADGTGAAVPWQTHSCEVCRRVADACFKFLCRFQYDLSYDSDLQRRVADCGGLCTLHTWQYAAIASPHGICTGYPALLEHVSAWLHSHADPECRADSAARRMESVLAREATCLVCVVRAKAAQDAVAGIATELRAARTDTATSRSALCLSHLCMLLPALDDARLEATLMKREAELLERLSEDMRRYATKHDGVRRYLASDEEAHASERAIELLAGVRNVNAGLRIT